jgi:hypothetical protein
VPSVDVRSRTAADVEPVDPGWFFDEELPRLAEERGALVTAGGRELAPRPLVVEVDGRAWTLALDDDAGVTVTPGADGPPAHVRLGEDDLADVVHDLRTPMGLFTGGDLDMPAGRLEDFLDWWVILRGLIDARAVHTTGAVTFTDIDGAPLDL